MKLPVVILKLISNKYVLYIVAFLALMNVLANVMLGNIYLVALFLIIGYGMSYFSKNMVLVLLVPLFIVSVLMSGLAVKEGFATAKSNNKKKTIVDPEDDSIIEIENEDNSNEVDDSGDDSGDNSSPSESFEVGKKKQSRVDYGSTIEKAYDDLNNILGNEGISKLTEDTQKLMKQQVQLAEAMKGMSPMLEKAQGMLQSLNINELGDLGSIVKKLGVNAN